MYNFGLNYVQTVHLPQKRFLGKIECYYCIHTVFFHAVAHENKIRLLENADLIGLSLMVVLFEIYLQHVERKAIAEALTKHVQTKTFKRYADDSHARFPSKHQANTFQVILKLFKKF